MDGELVPFHLHRDGARGQGDGIGQQEAAEIRIQIRAEGYQSGGETVTPEENVPPHHQSCFENFPDQHRQVGAEYRHLSQHPQLLGRAVVKKAPFQCGHQCHDYQSQSHHLDGELSVEKQPEKKQQNIHNGLLITFLHGYLS